MTAPQPEIVEAVGRLLRADPSRARTVADALRAPGRSFESTVSGGSMWPGLAPGMRIRVALVHDASYVPGEVVAYMAGDQVVVHRIVFRGRSAAARGHLVLIGDATLVPDPPVSEARVLGAVTGIWEGGAWVPAPGAPRRSLHARCARALFIAGALVLLHLSPRVAERAVLSLHRTIGPLRRALHRFRSRNFRRHPAVR